MCVIFWPYFIIKLNLLAEFPRQQITASNPQENVEFSLFFYVLLYSLISFYEEFALGFVTLGGSLATCSQLLPADGGTGKTFVM